MDISKVLELDKTAKFKDEWNGVPYSFEAKTSIITPKFLQSLADLESKPMEFAAEVSRFMVSWDIDFAGEEFPPTAENLQRLPIEFSVRLVEKVGESWSGNEQKPKRSLNGSAASAK